MRNITLLIVAISFSLFLLPLFVQGACPTPTGEIRVCTDGSSWASCGGTLVGLNQSSTEDLSLWFKYDCIDGDDISEQNGFLRLKLQLSVTGGSYYNWRETNDVGCEVGVSKYYNYEILGSQLGIAKTDDVRLYDGYMNLYWCGDPCGVDATPCEDHLLHFQFF